ncbi:GntR family transcriptional regulator [Duganella sp. 3397]|uniref:HTH-type transcriptional repressor YtrA n=1 Tax=Duganella phyllosphaerae TaxID=762836 RepID=A0A1E7WKR8_9BURK|nr:MULTISPECIES: GntR family transcriptional regulator [Duganella]MDR7051513.1 GntR family transcriptional regulator [Duganella sp. 3397]OEZ99590.1 HTH-type transcriptional repressor YtrA [Duganella phyllosphaerae]
MNLPRRSPLMLQIATGDPRPINRQIVDGVKRLIASGELVVGAGLPSVRGLATQLAVNPNTVAKAYTELTTEGWLDARAGLGLFVATPRQRLSDTERERRLNEAVVRFVGDVISLGYPDQVLLDRVAAELTLIAPKHRG